MPWIRAFRLSISVPSLRQSHQGVADRHRVAGFHRDTAHGPGLRGADFGSIFMASRISSTSPAATVWPSLASTFQIVPASGRSPGTGAGRGGSGGCRGRSSRRQLADVTAVADFDHKGFAFHLHGVDAGDGRFSAFATGCAASACGTGSKAAGLWRFSRNFRPGCGNSATVSTSSMAFSASVMPFSCPAFHIRFQLRQLRLQQVGRAAGHRVGAVEHPRLQGGVHRGRGAAVLALQDTGGLLRDGFVALAGQDVEHRRVPTICEVGVTSGMKPRSSRTRGFPPALHPDGGRRSAASAGLRGW